MDETSNITPEQIETVLADNPQPNTVRGPLRAPAKYYVGMRFVHKDTERFDNGRVAGRRDKLARRLIRKRLLRQESSIERAIIKSVQWRRELENLGDNSHERKRYVEEAITESRWWVAQKRMWALIGYAVKARAIYAASHP